MIAKRRIKERGYLRIYLSGPFIYMMIIPLVIMDLFITLYHTICFSLYGIKKIKRADYIKIDRHLLSYLGFVDKIHCVYCGYANGLINYTQKITGETEKYWCPLKHKKTKKFQEPSHHKDFLKYGDKKAFNTKFKI